MSRRLPAALRRRQLPLIAEPPRSYLVPGAGERNETCARYDACITAYAREQGGANGHCPVGCVRYRATEQGAALSATYARGEGPVLPPPVWWGTADEHDEPEPPARHTYTHEEIAKELGVTREKVRAIEAMAMRKVRARMLPKANALLN